MTKTAILLGVLLGAPATAGAQASAQIVRGLVQMELSSKAVIDWEAVRITIQPRTGSSKPRETYTDREGMYYFADVPAGAYVLVAETPDRQRQRYAVTVAAGTVNDVPRIALKANENYIEAFRDGMEAVDARQWKIVEQLMTYTIKLQSTTGSKSDATPPVRMNGMRTVSYAPHYYLGLALKEQGNCPAALKEFDYADAEVKQDTSLASNLAGLRARCSGSK